MNPQGRLTWQVGSLLSVHRLRQPCSPWGQLDPAGASGNTLNQPCPQALPSLLCGFALCGLCTLRAGPLSWASGLSAGSVLCACPHPSPSPPTDRLLHRPCCPGCACYSTTGQNLRRCRGSSRGVYLRDLGNPGRQHLPAPHVPTLAPSLDPPGALGRVPSPFSPPQQTFGSGFPGGIIFAGSGQAAPRPEPSCACEELLSPPERIFQVFFSRTHFLFINESLYCEKRRLFLEQRQLSLHCLFFPFPIILLVSCLGISGGRSRPVIPLGLEMQAPPPPGPLRGGAKPPGFTRAVRLEALLYVC